MAAIRYTKADWVAQVDIREMEDGRFRGIVQMRHAGKRSAGTEHAVEALSDSPEQALEQAQALAHRLLANISA